MTWRRKHWLWVAALAFALPARADAHLIATGLGPVYDGAGHWLTSPEDFIPVIALAILAGLRGKEQGRRMLSVLPVAWLLGGLAGLFGSAGPNFSQPVLSGIVAVTFLVPGILVLSDMALPASVVAAVAVVIGLVHGFLDAGGMLQEGVSTRLGVLQFLGMSALLFVLVALLAALVVSLRRPWERIVARVAGSWIAAAGLLLLGWSLRGVG